MVQMQRFKHIKIDKTDIISKDAYILFYKRKEFTASNIINFTCSSILKVDLHLLYNKTLHIVELLGFWGFGEQY
jgi:hypothetical protein